MKVDLIYCVALAVIAIVGWILYGIIRYKYEEALADIDLLKHKVLPPEPVFIQEEMLPNRDIIEQYVLPTEKELTDVQIEDMLDMVWRGFGAIGKNYIRIRVNNDPFTFTRTVTFWLKICGKGHERQELYDVIRGGRIWKDR